MTNDIGDMQYFNVSSTLTTRNTDEIALPRGFLGVVECRDKAEAGPSTPPLTLAVASTTFKTHVPVQATAIRIEPTFFLSRHVTIPSVLLFPLDSLSFRSCLLYSLFILIFLTALRASPPLTLNYYFATTVYLVSEQIASYLMKSAIIKTVVLRPPIAPICRFSSH
jgi:hypothetical protein